MGLLDMLGGLGTTPPSYMEGLLGAQATEDLRKRSIGSGLVNALIGYAAMPKNENLGLGRILAGAAQQGMQGARGVYDQAGQDLVMQQRLTEMQRKNDQEKALQSYLSGITDPNERTLAALDPAAFVKGKLTPRDRKTATVGNQVVDVATGEVIYTGTQDKKTTNIDAGDKILVVDSLTGETIREVPKSLAPQAPKEAPTSIQEYQYAKGQGYAGTFEQFKKDVVKAGATSINMPSESERTAGFLTSRLQNSFKQLTEVLTNNPNAASPKVGAEAVKLFTGSDYLKNLANPAARQQIENAQLEILDAALTLGTGAAYTREQLQNYSKSYFPQLGDKAPAIKDKQDRLNALLRSANIKAGRAAPEDVGLPPNVSVQRIK